MSNQCQGCGSEMKFVPAGTSKATGRPYNAFWACTAKCGYRNTTPVVATPPQARAMNNIAKQSEDAKWEAISTGKVRCVVACEYIRLGKTLEESVSEIDEWTKYIMSGNYNQTDNIPF